MAPPNLDDAAERAAYRRELRGVGRGLRLGGLWLAAVGLGLVLARRYDFLDVPLWAAVGAAGAGVMLMVSGVAARTRYHVLRMRG